MREENLQYRPSPPHRAGLPVGSTSYYLRSRAALLEAAVTRLTELDTETLASFDASSTNPAGVLTSILQEALTGQGRVRTLARYGPSWKLRADLTCAAVSRQAPRN